jgi:hypothetical protein
MLQSFLKILLIAQLMNLAVYAQSLGDVARENQEKKTADDASGVQPKMFTNRDLRKDPEASPEPSEEQPQPGASVGNNDHRFAEERPTEQHAAEQWKREILTQENKMTNLQARIDQLNASMHAAGGSAQYEGPYNRYQARQLQRVAHIQQQLDEQKRKLDEMQEAARRAGMRSAVYDP